MIYKSTDRYKLFCGDITSQGLFDSEFHNEFADLIITSPPYNVGILYDSVDDTKAYGEYLNFSLKWMQNCFRKARYACRFCLNIPIDTHYSGEGTPFSYDLVQIAKKAGWKYKTTIVWGKTHLSNSTAWGSFMDASSPQILCPCELIIIFYKGAWKKPKGLSSSTVSREDFLSWTVGLWSFNGETSKKWNHPAPFPEELPRRLIHLLSFDNDLVFDPFCGSGTTGVVAVREGRIFVGSDISSSYLDGSAGRIDNDSFVSK